MKARPYPLGHPEVLTRERLLTGGPGSAAAAARRCPPLPWKRVADNPFTGFLLCRVCPPTGRVLGERKPVLPMRTSGGGTGADQRLVFALCRSCANSGAGQSPPPCRHSKHQRSWVAGYTHFELNKALELGYTVIDLYEVCVCFYRLHVFPYNQVWHYAEWSATPGTAGGIDLFRGYIDEWVRLKAEASGWPSGCGSPEQRAAYVQEWEEREGIRLNPANIRFNPGLRQLAVSIRAIL